MRTCSSQLNTQIFCCRKIAIRYIDIVAGLAITRDGNIGEVSSVLLGLQLTFSLFLVAVDSVTPTIFVILEHGELLRWFDCADYMREPSDIAVAGTDFYVCDFKVCLTYQEPGTDLRLSGSQRGCLH